MPRFYTQNYSLYRAGKVFIAFADLSRKTIRIALLVGLTSNRRVHIMGLNEWRFCSTLMFQKCFKHDFDLIEIVISVVMVRKLNWSKHNFSLWIMVAKITNWNTNEAGGWKFLIFIIYLNTSTPFQS